MKSKAAPVDILVVEDNASERGSIVQALEEAICGVRIVSVDNGTSALDFLLERGDWVNRKGALAPKLILMDLGLPGTSGISVLAQIRALNDEDALTLAPVVIFSDSQDAGDIKRSYRCGASSYVMKPLSHPDFQRVVKQVGKYWMEHNRVPA